MMVKAVLSLNMLDLAYQENLKHQHLPSLEATRRITMTMIFQIISWMTLKLKKEQIPKNLKCKINALIQQMQREKILLNKDKNLNPLMIPGEEKHSMILMAWRRKNPRLVEVQPTSNFYKTKNVLYLGQVVVLILPLINKLTIKQIIKVDNNTRNRLVSFKTMIFNQEMEGMVAKVSVQLLMLVLVRGQRLK